MTGVYHHLSSEWIGRLVPAPDVFETVVTAAVKFGMEGPGEVVLAELEKSADMPRKSVMEALDDCDATLERLYGFTLFASASRPKLFRYSGLQPAKLALSTRFRRVCADGGLLQPLTTNGIGYEKTPLIREIVAAAEDNMRINVAVPVPASAAFGERLVFFIEDFLRELTSATYDIGVDIYLPRLDANGRLLRVNGGMTAFAAGLLAGRRKIIVCGRPDFALSRDGFLAWDQGKGNYLCVDRQLDRHARAWVIAATPGVKLWFYKAGMPFKFRELFTALPSTDVFL